MSTVYGVNRTLANTPEESDITDPGLLEGKVRVMTDTYEAASTASGTVIEVGRKLPVKARILEIELITDALGSSRTLTVGDYNDVNRYITATTCNTGNLRTRLLIIDGFLYEILGTHDTKTGGEGLSTDRQIILTVGGGSASGTIKLVIYYTYE